MYFFSSLQKEAERRVVGFIVTIVTQRLQVLLKLRFGLRQLKACQHAAKIGAVAAVVEQ